MVRYEAGAPIPGVILLCFVEVVDVEPHWLRPGEGWKYRLRSRDTPGRW
jgi:hypothetical protein